MASLSISQVVGDVPKAAWDILPLNIKDVARATHVDKKYGKLFIAVPSGRLDHKDPDVSKFSGIFEQLYIEDEV